MVNNIDVAVQTSPDGIRDALVRQAFGPVRWVEVTHALRARGLNHVFECGPGKVLSGLVKRVDAEIVSMTVHAVSYTHLAGREAEDLDLIIVATSTPDMVFPSTACILQHKLGVAGCPAFDMQAVCSGFVYALAVADAMVRAGSARCALVVGAEVFSRILDFDDRTTCVLFGDGAGAVVLEASAEPGILATDLHADGRHVAILCVPGTVSGGQVLGDPLLKMDGQAVFKLAVNVLDSAARAVLEKAGRTEADLDWLIPHQANIRIMHSTARKLKLPLDKLVVTVHEHGNTSAASVPLALDAAVRSGRVQRGDTVMLEGVGGGFTWGAVLLDF